MSGRGLTPGAETAAQSSVACTAWLCAIESDPPVYLWTGFEELEWDDKTFLPLGHFAGVSRVGEAKGVKATGFDFSLSGIPSEYLSLFQSQRIRLLPCTLWLAFFTDATHATVIGDPVPFIGRLDAPKIQEGGETSTLRLAVEGPFIDIERPRETRWTDQYQKLRDPSDRGFEFVAGLQNKVIAWGAVSNAGASMPSDGMGDSGEEYVP